MLNCLENATRLRFDSYVIAVKLFTKSTFQSTRRPNSNTAGISLDAGLKYSTITHMSAKKPLHPLGSYDNFQLIQISSILSVNFTSHVA